MKNGSRQPDDDMVRRLKQLHAGGMWDWLFASVERAMSRGDRQRQLMVRLLCDGGEGIQGDFERGLDLLNRGRALAHQLDEHWWVALFDHWRLQILLKKGDYPLGRELAMHLVAEVRKPRYEGLPLRICIQEDLIRLCIDTDPVGYAPRIEHGLQTMATLVDPRTYCYRCLRDLHVEYAKALRRWDALERAVQGTLAVHADEPRSLAIDHTNLCRLAYERGDREELARWVTAGEALARKSTRDDCLAEFLVWRALLAVDADPIEAERLVQEALAVQERVAGPPHGDIYDVLCSYYETAGTPERALDARFAQLKTLANKGRLALELHCRAEICRLLMVVGKPARNQLATARKVARDLSDPAPTLALLDRLDRAGPGGARE